MQRIRSIQHSIIIFLLVCLINLNAKAQFLPPVHNTNIKINYVRTWDLTAPEQDVSAINIKPLRDAKQATQYIDGLGRPLETVIKQGSLATGSTATDLVTANYYDKYGRELYKYLPFAANTTGGNSSLTDGLFKYNPFDQQASFMNVQYSGQGETWFYNQSNVESSPLNRPEKSLAVGNSWVGSNRGVETKYWFNTDIDDVKKWVVTDVSNGFGTYNVLGTYSARTLFKNVLIDENGKQVIEFKDKSGKVILKKVQLTAADDGGTGKNYTGWLCTYYIYDDLNNLRCVVQPRGVEALIENSWNINALSGVILNEQCFRYEYDGRNRMILKKVPGADEVYMVYDNRDRLVMTQDANMRASGKWMAMLYDELNRPVQTGLLLNTWTGKSFTQHLSDAANSSSYPFTAGTTPSTTYWEYLTKTGYDDYNSLPGGSGLNSNLDNTYINSNYINTSYNTAPDYPQPLVASTSTEGLVTWTEVKILGTNTYTYAISIYDDMGRVIQVKTKNVTGGTDLVTTQYSWSGQPLYTIQQVQKGGGTSQTTVTLTKLNYDDLGRLTKTEKKVSHNLVNGASLPASYTTLAEQEYDALGQLKKKKLGNKPGASGTALANLDYQYNIRGWLLSINKDFISASSNNDQYFAMQLGYDKDGYGSFPNKQYNGNISGTIWKTAGDNINRKFDYAYDNANRLLSADFNQSTGGTSFDKSAGLDFSLSSMSYDANGNIKTMQQKGWKFGGSVIIDNLQYNYLNNGYSNKLLNVIDLNNDPLTKLGDFRTSNLHPNAGGKTTTTVDYTYDANGNMVKDYNKDIVSSSGTEGIQYNYLNLPQTITVKKDGSNNKGTISYVYDAAGTKLQKITTETNGNVIKDGTSYTTNITTTTTYLGGLVYESKAYSNASLASLQYTDRLQFIAHEEGRIRFTEAQGSTAAKLDYDYFIKDHLGNIRMLLTEEVKQDAYPTLSYEGAAGSTEVQGQDAVWENKTGSSINVTSARTSRPGNFGTSGSNGSYVQLVRKSTGAIGGAKLLKVMAGDRIHASLEYYYTVANANNSPASGINSLIANFASALSASPAVGGLLKDASTAVTSSLQNNATLSSLLNTPNNTSGGNNAPKAYLNILFFNEQFVFDNTSSQVIPVAYTPNTKATINRMAANALTALKNGYVYIYFSNESDELVYFDNFMLTHERGRLLEETHYGAWGLSLAGLSSKSLSEALTNRYKYNGKEEQRQEFSDGGGLEWLDYGARVYDQQIGRWHSIDPKVEKYNTSSPYVFSNNNPVLIIDFNGADTTIANNKTGNLLIFFNYNNEKMDYKKLTNQKSFDIIIINSIDNLSKLVEEYLESNGISELNTVLFRNHGNANLIEYDFMYKQLTNDDARNYLNNKNVGSSDLIYLKTLEFISNKMKENGQMIFSACHAGNGELPMLLGEILLAKNKNNFTLFFNRDLSTRPYMKKWSWKLHDMGIDRYQFQIFNASMTSKENYKSGWTFVFSWNNTVYQSDKIGAVGVSGENAINPIMFFEMKK